MANRCISTHPRGSRCVLSETQVLDIFRFKASESEIEAGIKSTSLAIVQVAKLFGISTKTVRDIWLRRTWYRTTLPLEPTRSDTMERLGKRPGRPRGIKDSKPRMRKAEVKGLRTKIVEDHSETVKAVLADMDEHRAKPVNPWTYSVDTPTLKPQDRPFEPLLKCGEHDFVDPFHDDWKYWPSNSKP